MIKSIIISEYLKLNLLKMKKECLFLASALLAASSVAEVTHMSESKGMRVSTLVDKLINSNLVLIYPNIDPTWWLHTVQIGG